MKTYLLTCATVALACAQPLAAETLIFGQTATLPTLDPYNLSPAHEPINNTLYDALTRYDDQLVPQPRLAESWEFSEDGTALTLNLREGVTFHNGRAFTSQDVANTVEHVLDPANGALIQSFAKRITSVETPDDMTVVLNFEAPFPGVFDLLELMYIADVEASGDFSQTGIGTGPFALASHASGTATNLQRNADYWDGAPTLDGIEIMTVPNQQATLLALRSGDIDMVTELGYIDLVPFTRDGSFVTGDAPSGVAHDITINSRSAPLDNVAVREAIDLAIDRDRIARLLFGEFGQTLCLPFTEESLVYVAAQDDCRYDLDEAKTVLEGAGVELPLSLRMLTSTEVRTEYTTIAEIMQADLAKIGINLEIENVDAVTYRRRYVQEQDFDLASHAYGRAGKDPSSLLETTVVFKPEGNVSGFSDASYAEAVTQGGSTPDNDARRAAYAGASEFLRDSHHVLSLVSRPRLWVTSEDIEGVSFSADGFAIFQNATKAD
ncbi:hypothetical protein ATO2_02515 [Roseovarius sp. 22II1-1F6A]|nr:hypothetical protein ATO2_02515 [Roseovarius sp. 22II1-1F6A]